ncbi:ABC transporter ATP-binding protein [Aeromicrobium tamlense]|uniref:ABC transporter ATP-binding protein n=1 Tax=Aeromicrobium tamlense TaxID=375541 RepID=A0A8I0FV57_9ACTN|nr:ABC transporter ATP-binding protein [Aeromicrobium tamlense]MBD1269591.1 ABC transporter ATP-binding protein [Aeromicrobium tamlense]NYI39754.1 biotin transport system ATP-binding protein [Aeromicrobium tamlense]
MIELVEAAVAGRLEPTTLRLEERRIAIVGSNGSGKSTLARLVNGLVEPTSGQVLVDGLDTRRHGREVRRRVGFVFTDPAAQLVMPTVAEDVALSLRKRHRDKAEREAAVLAVLERFGLADLAERSVHALSGGQRQLLAIATVLATDPDVLVADEPTTLLDLANTRRVGDVLLGLPQQVVLVTHDLDLAARCDRALVVHAGRVAFDGPAATAVDHYRALVS